MECNRCGGLMMSETVIKLRRRFIGFRETRSQGAYCATCKIGVLLESHPAETVPHARKIVPRPSPAWLTVDFWPAYASQPSVVAGVSGRRPL